MNDNDSSVGRHKAPIWFWALSGLALLWNLAGLSVFLMGFMVPVEKMFPDPEMQKLASDSPLWYHIVFGTAVIAGTLGCVGLLMRAKWAIPVFVISLLGVIAQQCYMYFFSDTLKVMGGGAMVMPTMVLIICIALIWFAKRALSRGWLR